MKSLVPAGGFNLESGDEVVHVVLKDGKPELKVRTVKRVSESYMGNATKYEMTNGDLSTCSGNFAFLVKEN